MKLDTKQGEGLEAIWKDYQIIVIKKLLDNSSIERPVSSRDMWEHCNDVMGQTISRASVINFLNEGVDEGYFQYKETTGKGGYRRLYYMTATREQFESWVKLQFKEKLDEIFGLAWWK